MSNRGRALSIPEKQMVVHVKHYFDKEKELSHHSLIALKHQKAMSWGDDGSKFVKTKVNIFNELQQYRANRGVQVVKTGISRWREIRACTDNACVENNRFNRTLGRIASYFGSATCISMTFPSRVSTCLWLKLRQASMASS